MILSHSFFLSLFLFFSLFLSMSLFFSLSTFLSHTQWHIHTTPSQDGKFSPLHHQATPQYVLLGAAGDKHPGRGREVVTDTGRDGSEMRGRLLVSNGHGSGRMAVEEALPMPEIEREEEGGVVVKVGACRCRIPAGIGPWDWLVGRSRMNEWRHSLLTLTVSPSLLTITAQTETQVV